MERVTRVAQSDRGLREWASAAGLLDASSEWMTSETGHAVLRRLWPIIALRDAFLRSDGTRRKHKLPTTWNGAPTALLLFDGNPRHLLSFFALVLADVPGRGPATATGQARAIQSLNDRFAALLGTMSGDSDATPSWGSVLALVDVIGGHFAAVLYGPFDPDPPLSFVVDQAVPDGVVSLIEAAANAGAIVRAPTRAGTGPMLSVRTERFRLANILAPRYRLPLRFGPAVPLSTVLGSTVAAEPLFRD